MTTVPITLVFFYKGLLDYFIDKGFEITVITSPDEQHINKLSPRAKYVLIPMLREVSLLNDLRALIRIIRVLKDGKFDIIQYCTPKAAFLGSIASWLCRVQVRLYLMWGIYYVSQAGLLRVIMKITEKLTCFFSTHVSPDSYGNYHFAISEGLCPVEKMSVVGEGTSCGVDLDRFNPVRLQKKKVDVRNSLNIPSGSIVIGFVGRLCRDKGINELVLAFKELIEKKADLYLLLVGPMEEKFCDFDSAVQEMLQYNRNILRVGYQDKPEEFLAAMDIFVLPTYREGFPVASIEASAIELPIVSTDIPGARDAVVNGKTGILVRPKSTEDLRIALEAMINTPSLRRDMGAAGREWAKHFEQKLIWKQVVVHRETLLYKRKAPYDLNCEIRDRIPRMERRSVLVTGANGFIGRNLCAILKEKGCFVRGSVRNNVRDVTVANECIQVGDIDDLTDWKQALAGVDVVIHLAARVHIMNDPATDSIEAFRRVNLFGTERLARLALKAGVRRFIFLSSIGVNGEFTEKEPFTEDSVPNPVGVYAVLKWEAEQLLRKLAEGSGMEVVILRAPLVYGLDAPGNFTRLIGLIKTGIPLPLWNANSLHSFIYLGNLLDAISACVTHPRAAGETFLVSDGQDVSTSDLIKMIASAMNKRVILFYLHPNILKVLFRIAGKTDELEKLIRPLLVDSSKIINLLGWKPLFTLEDGVRSTVIRTGIASSPMGTS